MNSTNPGNSTYNLIGKNVARVDAPAKATGRAQYVADIRLPRMLHGKILRSPHPHAEILSIDAGAAERLPGVAAVITAKDTGEIRHGTVDNAYNPCDEFVLATRKVRYIGEEVAAVAASREDIAEEALRLIKVQYRPLKPVFAPEEALKKAAPAIHEPVVRQPSPGTAAHSPLWQMLAEQAERAGQKDLNNVAARFLMEHGDINRGFQEADHVREDRFIIPATAHAALESHAALASYSSSEGFSFWLSHMGGEVKRYWLSRTLDEPLKRVRVHKTYVGGAFGGKVGFFPYEFLAGFLSRKCGRPVLISLSTEDVFTACKTDHGMVIDIKTGIKKDGTLVAQEMHVLDDCGAYRGSAPIALFLTYLWSIPVYRIANIKHEGIAIYTNKSGAAAKRGHGALQSRFAVDVQLDMLARDIGLDPVEIRLRNVSKAGDRLPNGDTLASCGLAGCIEKAAEISGWKTRRGEAGRGMGMALATMFTGTYRPPLPPGSNALIKMNPDGSATLYAGCVEFGQGSETAMCQIAAEELGIGIDQVNIVSGDTELCPADVGNFLSNGVRVNGQAVRRAAADARRQLLEGAGRLLSLEASDLDARAGAVHAKHSPDRVIPFSRLIADMRRAGMPEVMGKGFCPMLEAEPGTSRYSDAYSFAVAVAEVQVDRELGRVDVKNLYMVSDSGTVINPQGATGQLEGQAISGQGDALFEKIIREDGQTMNPSFLDYKLPGALDTAPVVASFVETFEPKGAFGGKEVGEGARGAIAPAIANAVSDATGAGIRELPITPDMLLDALRSPATKNGNWEVSFS